MFFFFLVSKLLFVELLDISFFRFVKVECVVQASIGRETDLFG